MQELVNSIGDPPRNTDLTGVYNYLEQLEQEWSLPQFALRDAAFIRGQEDKTLGELSTRIASAIARHDVHEEQYFRKDKETIESAINSRESRKESIYIAIAGRITSEAIESCRHKYTEELGCITHKIEANEEVTVTDVGNLVRAEVALVNEQLDKTADLPALEEKSGVTAHLNKRRMFVETVMDQIGAGTYGNSEDSLLQYLAELEKVLDIERQGKFTPMLTTQKQVWQTNREINPGIYSRIKD